MSRSKKKLRATASGNRTKNGKTAGEFAWMWVHWKIPMGDGNWGRELMIVKALGDDFSKFLNFFLNLLNFSSIFALIFTNFSYNFFQISQNFPLIQFKIS